jgi:uncharacterized protein YoxC
MNHDLIELAFVGVAALALVTQTIILLAIYIGVSKGTKSIKGDFEGMRSSIMPTVDKARELVEKTRTLVDRVSPQIESATTDVAELARVLRVQTAEIEATVDQILERVRSQTGRIDHMFSGTLDAVDKAGGFLTHAVEKPVRQISGLVAALKAIIESLRSSEGHQEGHGVADDQDMFV